MFRHKEARNESMTEAESTSLRDEMPFRRREVLYLFEGYRIIFVVVRRGFWSVPRNRRANNLVQFVISE